MAITSTRRRKASALVAIGATAALVAGTAIPAAPANAALDLFPLSIGTLGELPVPGVAACDAGDNEVDVDLLTPATADCTGASPWLLTQLADGAVGLFAPDLAKLFTFGGMNGALATPGVELDLSIDPLNPIGGLLNDSNVLLPGKSTIKGSGYNTAVTVLGGEATAKSDYILAGAVAVAAAGGIADANSLFGMSLATAIGRPATQITLEGLDLPGEALDTPDIALGSPRVKNGASAKALPFGIAIANSSLTPAELLPFDLSDTDLSLGGVQDILENGLPNVKQYQANSVALGGVAAAYRSFDGSKGAVCSALYGEARVHEQTLDDDGNVSSSKRTNSCTSVLFIFQKQQNTEKYGEGVTVYAIKNPFDVGLVSPYGDNLADFVSDATGSIVNLGPLNDILAGKFVPEYQSDIIRLEVGPNGAMKVDTDLFKWLGELFGSLGGATNTNALRTVSPTVAAFSLNDIDTSGESSAAAKTAGTGLESLTFTSNANEESTTKKTPASSDDDNLRGLNSGTTGSTGGSSPAGDDNLGGLTDNQDNKDSDKKDSGNEQSGAPEPSLPGDGASQDEKSKVENLELPAAS